MLLFFTFLLFLSCKNEDALSKVDPNSKDVAFNPNEVSANTSTQNNAQPNQNSSTTPVDGKFPELTFSKKEHNFGVIKEGEKVETTFKFTNTGTSDLIINSASGSCGCTVPDYPKEPIKPGATAKMKVSFDSNGKPGKQKKSVKITCNTKTGRDEIFIVAEVTPKKTQVITTTSTPAVQPQPQPQQPATNSETNN